MAWRRDVSCSSACESAGELGICDMLWVFVSGALGAGVAGMEVRCGDSGDGDGAFAVAGCPLFAHSLEQDGEGG